MRKSIFIWLVAIPLAIAATGQAFGFASYRRNPEFATKLFPPNGNAYAALAELTYREAIIDSGMTGIQALRPETRSNAINAFRLEPTSSGAISLLAIDEDARGHHRQARALFHNVIEMTRRDAVADVWVGADLAQQNKQSIALRYFDIAMRTNPAFANQLLPKVVGLLKHDRSISAVGGLLLRQPPWGNSFWYIAFRTPGIVQNLGRLRLFLADHPQFTVEPDIDEALLKQLVSNGFISEAADLERKLVKGRTDKMDTSSVLLGKNSDHGGLVPFAWEWFSNGDAGTAQIGESVAINALPRTPRMTIGQRLVALAPGKHTVTIDLAAPPISGYDLSFEVSCASQKIGEDARVISKVAIRSRNTTAGLRVDPACPYQWLKFNLSTNDNAPVDGPAIEFVTIR